MFHNSSGSLICYFLWNIVNRMGESLQSCSVHKERKGGMARGGRRGSKLQHIGYAQYLSKCIYRCLLVRCSKILENQGAELEITTMTKSSKNKYDDKISTHFYGLYQSGAWVWGWWANSWDHGPGSTFLDGSQRKASRNGGMFTKHCRPLFLGLSGQSTSANEN